MWPFTRNEYKSIVESKRAERTRLIETHGVAFNSDLHTKFLKAGAREIVAKIETGEWTAVQVVEAYIARATAAHAQTNCGTEILFAPALKRAKQLDEEYARTKQLRGPFHGVPFSVKDQYDVVGFDSTIGFTQWANKPVEKNAVLVDQLIDLGAIPIIKSNVPQTMFAFECCNPLWGRTLNPYNDGYTCGGSSGGEGALLALDGAVFGIGSDIGGSLRIPTTYCGIYSLKPTAGRISRAGARAPTEGDSGILVTMGPMGRSIDELDVFCRNIFGLHDNHLDHVLAPVPYREAELQSKLKFGYYTFDGYTKASPANKRAVMEAVDALQKQGHECIELTDFPSAAESMKIFLGLTSSDAYRKLTSHLGPDPMENTIWLPVYGSRVPALIRSFAAWVLESLVGDTFFGGVLRAAGSKSFSEWTEYSAERNRYIKKFYEEVWHKHGLDGIIAPVQSMPQMPHGGAAQLNSLAATTVQYNLVDSPCGVLPVTTVDPAKDALTDEWTKLGPKDGSVMMHDLMYKSKKPFYDPVAMKGMPVGVQIVGRKHEDEKVLKMMRVVDDALGERGFGTGLSLERTNSVGRD